MAIILVVTMAEWLELKMQNILGSCPTQHAKNTLFLEMSNPVVPLLAFSISFIGLPLLPNLWMSFKPSVSLSSSVSSSYLLIYSSFNHLAMRMVRLGFCGWQHEFDIKIKARSYLSLPERCHLIVFWPPLFLVMSSTICIVSIECDVSSPLPAFKICLHFWFVILCLHVDFLVFIVLWV